MLCCSNRSQCLIQRSFQKSGLTSRACRSLGNFGSGTGVRAALECSDQTKLQRERHAQGLGPLL